MGNGQSRDDFADVVPSAVADKLSAAASSSKPPPIANAQAARPSATRPEQVGVQQPVADSAAGKTPQLVGKIIPPGHALQLEERAVATSDEADNIARAFRNAQQVEERFVIPESVRKSRTLDAYADVCSEILPGFLYVSNLRVARDSAKLRALGITHVINCCGELKHYEDGVEQPDDSDLDALKLLLRDDASEDLTPFLPRVMEYIAACRQRSQGDQRARVLVHCHQGVSRSCAFAIAYVMLEQRLSYHEAFAMVKRQRAISSPNAAFICQLLEWEKDLEAMGATAPASALGGLHRLAPHSNYDPECLVLKRCYEPSCGSARQRQNVVNVRAPDDERRVLWSHGTFVFQSPTAPAELVVWHGSKCAIPEAVATATRLATQLLRMEALVLPTPKQMEIIEVYERAGEHRGTDSDIFGYAAELLWTKQSAPKIPSLLLPPSVGVSQPNQESPSASAPGEEQRAVPPQLFILEAIGAAGGADFWDQLKNYDSEDLTPDNAFLVFSVQAQGLVEGYVWLGASCKFTSEQVVEAAQKQLRSLQNAAHTAPPPPLRVERQNEESDAFWALFEAGY
jgi:protein-tyrosine phosphatase